jgi:mannose/fructose/N-acetylgalactosamine-specific phosphotransferase system component IID
MTSIYWLCVSLIVGGIGAILFIVGILMSLVPLVATGIGLIGASIVGLLMNYFYGIAPTPSVPQNLQYSTNNMNTMVMGMKRNKSDTDLELINKQSDAAESGQIL